MSTMIVLDMQGFVINKEFIVKELAASNGYQIYHFIFKPPIDFEMLSKIKPVLDTWNVFITDYNIVKVL